MAAKLNALSRNKPFYISISLVYVVSVVVGFAFLARYLDTLWGTHRILSLGMAGKLTGGTLFVLGFVLWISAPTILVLKGRGIPLERTDGLAIGFGTQRLVRVGPFRHVRNPMYVGYLTVFFAVGLLLDSPLMAFVFCPLWWLQTHLLLILEEKHLERRFGDEYRRYKEEVPRWIPRLSRGGPR
jgi:protein-S-isoprenylcysteine O-methyltransferase Ste14